MEIFSELTKKENLALALGYFDGVHLGHRAVINSAVNFAHQRNSKSAVITFKDHPCCFFYGVCPKYILTREERRKKIAELGVDYLFELDFGSISTLGAEDYLNEILVKYFSPISISTGFNHNFGANRSGDCDFLARMAGKYGYKYFKIPEEKLGQETVSSTTIRHLLTNGEMEKSAQMLGYNFVIAGEVIKGRQLGRQLGFRTANIAYPAELIDLPFGAYQTICTVKGKIYKGVTNFGIRPTVSNENMCTVETHLLDFDDDIYGEIIRVEFLKMLRPEMKFNSLDELKKQIAVDIGDIKTISP